MLKVAPCVEARTVSNRTFLVYFTIILYNYGATLRVLCQRGVQKLRKPPPPLPYHTPSPLTNSELCVTHLVVLTTEHKHVESEAYSVGV